ncbi:ABC transporter ATP-binding protein [Streptosporangium roseum]|uniref:ABC-type cobalt transport system, ATPase component n=1 Tax=Streptosporangium roseum (strain ATCC 12428 / DSM 43021 / JCM 3005 / KCTC 9067 / NCIMB 10171 / NRRL 2505 / NI 9100) TaxID=479432 RepID=D2B5W9_STRRD|nr:ABC transporter ATP-binding protein [Streptosporangium roseum]ACZ91423.1 ABC-type cobalt transport system, ATPase component [Streptosporangium roseum DSM 43021]
MIIEVRAASVRYQTTGRQVLAGVDLAVGPGDLALVSGPSGGGKSTLLRLLNGLIPHAYRAEVTGEVLVGGRPVARQSVRQLSTTVGTLLQDPRKQIVGTTVDSELAFGPENLGLPRAEIRRRIGEVVDRVGIRHLLGRATAELSGGELQMVAFAGVLVMRPQVVLVDEPLANLDLEASLRLMRELRRFVDDGGAAVVVEHRVEEILDFAPTQVLYLEDGRSGYAGDVAGFLAAAPVAHVKLPFGTLVDRAAELPAASDVSLARTGGPAVRRGRGGSAAARLEYRGVALGYAGQAVLDGVDLALGAGERVAVLGRNGAGKSTLLRAAVRLLEPLRGAVHVDGEPVTERSTLELATTFGYVFQNPGQALFCATVGDELAFGPRNLGWPADEIRRVSEDALRAMLLDDETDVMDRSPRTLSFGQQRRLTVALALAMRPRTLILDEPTAGQDLHATTRFMAQVMAASESVYFITHDVDLALTSADRIIVVDGGRVVADAPAAELARDADVWSRAGLRQTSLVRAIRDHVHGAGGIPHPFDLARLIPHPEGTPPS